MRRFLSRLFNAKSRPARSRPARRARIGIEALEDRQLMTAGWLDPTFGYGGWRTVAFDRSGGVDDEARAVHIQNDGKIVVAGSAQYGTSGDYDFAVTRLNPDGSLDYSFGINGTATVAFDLGGRNADTATAVTEDAFGRILVAGTVERGNGNYDFGIVALTPDGWLDPSFGINGRSVAAFDLGGAGNDYATCMMLDGWGRIVVAGTAQYNANGDYDFAVARLTYNGWFDTSFSYDGKATVAFDLGGTRYDQVTAVALDHEWRIVLAGWADHDNYASDFALARLLDNGLLDSSFGYYGRQTLTFDQFYGGARTHDYANALAIDRYGRIVVAGGTYGPGIGNGAYAVTRLTDNGVIDTSFGWGGMQIVQIDLGSNNFDSCHAMTLDSQGRIILAGSSSVEVWTGTESRYTKDSTVARLTEDGWLDHSFGRYFGRTWFDATYDGSRDEAFGVALDVNGDIVVIGTSQYRWGSSDNDFYVARLHAEGE